MKLFRFGKQNEEKPGVCVNKKYYDASAIVHDYDAHFFNSGGTAILMEHLSNNNLPEIEIDRYGCPVKNPSKIVCIGLNYSDHAKETGAATPEEPVVFLKSTTAIIGAFDEVMIPKDSIKTDWEVELAVVIGKTASYVKEENAHEYIAGYCVHNDISERAFQLERGGTWDKGKGCDTFAPIGPMLITPDEITDINNLRLWLKVNDTIMQDGNTANLIFKIPFLISYVSRFMTLLPGDIISTGTPAGVGLGMKPPLYLKPGDVMELGIDQIGISTQKVVAFTQPC
ncbi:MAG: hypothetical protein RLY16_1669 [Bacteroidota bacterium]